MDGESVLESQIFLTSSYYKVGQSIRLATEFLSAGYPFDSGNHNKFMGQVSVVLHFMPQP